MPSSAELENLIQFDSSDLAANRMGQLSAKQKQNLQNRFMQETILSILSGLFLAALGYWFFDQGETLLGASLMIIGLLMPIAFAQLRRVPTADLHVQKVSAYLKKLSQTRPRRSYYSLEMGDVSFSTDKEHFESFEDGVLYTFYYYQRQPNSWLREAPRLLSVEFGGEPSPEKQKY